MSKKKNSFCVVVEQRGEVLAVIGPFETRLQAKICEDAVKEELDWDNDEGEIVITKISKGGDWIVTHQTSGLFDAVYGAYDSPKKAERKKKELLRDLGYAIEEYEGDPYPHDEIYVDRLTEPEEPYFI